MSESQFQTYTGLDYTRTTHRDTYPTIDPTKSKLTNRSILITGSNRGLGYSAAISYARAGTSYIAIAARKLSSLIPLTSAILSAAQSAGHPPPQILPLALDVQSPATIAAAAQVLTSTFKTLNILINNAGYLETFTPIIDSSPEAHEKAWQVNYLGVYHVTRAFLPLLLATDGGLRTIVNMTSIGALRIDVGASAYSISKLALVRFGEHVSAEYGDRGLVAYAVHPGGVGTELALRLPEDLHHLLTDTPELSADTLVFLTRERREWLAGRYISVNWDMDEFLAMKDAIVDGGKLKVRLTW